MWDERYSEQGFAYGDQANDFLREVEPRLPRGRALCLAEGEGRNAVYLAEAGFEVTAVDLSPVGLSKASELATRRGVEIATEVANLADFTIEPGHWDVIVSIWAHTPSSLRRSLHRRVVEGLRPGGAFVLEAYTPKQLEYATGGPPDPDMLMTLEGLREELSGLRFESGVETVREVREGRYHNGPSSVVQLLAFAPEVNTRVC